MDRFKPYFIWVLLLASFLARLFAFQTNFHFDNDIRIFQLWAIRLFEVGFSGFYSLDMHLDYPPVYMYVLYLLGAARAGVQAIFGEEFWQVLYSPTFRFFTFLPAILADLGIGFVIYKGLNRLRDTLSFVLLAAVAWLFNPAIILISGAWGQMESVFVLMLLVSLIFMRQKKLIPAYVLFGLAILTKPQSLFLAPVYLYSAYDFLRCLRFDKKAVKTLALSIGAGVLAMVLVSLPFGLTATVQQLYYGIGLYGHATVNAFNFWALIGANWRHLDAQFLGITYNSWGVIIALLIIAGTLAALHIDRKRHEGKNFFLIVAALLIMIFTFSIRMHERYLYPALLFLLMYYLENRKRRELIFYWAFSAVFFINCLEILRWANAGFDWSLIDNSSIYVVSALTVVLAVSVIFVLVRSLRKKQPTEDALPLDCLKNPSPMCKQDFAYIGLLIVVYIALAFVNLGDVRAPQTTWVAEDKVVYIDFGETVNFSQFQFLMGARHNIAFGLHSSVDGQEWELVHSASGGDVFAWAFVPLNTYARFMAIGGNAGLRLQEVAFRGTGCEILPVAGITPARKSLLMNSILCPNAAIL